MATRKTVTEEPVESNGEEPTAIDRPAEVTKIGNLTKQPQMRFTVQGKALTEVDLAVNPLPGEDKDVEFYRLLIFGDIGENVSESDLTTSTRVIVVGVPSIEEWDDKETGEHRTRKKIFVKAIGPDLRYAKVNEVQKIHRSKPQVAVVVENF